MASSYRSVAASVAQDKEQHPENYCPVKRCLWNTRPQGGGCCPRHKHLAPVDKAAGMAELDRLANEAGEVARAERAQKGAA